MFRGTLADGRKIFINAEQVEYIEWPEDKSQGVIVHFASGREMQIAERRTIEFDEVAYQGG
jgi:hypothetical protein